MNCGVTYCLNGNTYYTDNYMNLKYKNRKSKRRIEVHLSRNVINAAEKEFSETVKSIGDKDVSHINSKTKPRAINISSATTNTESLQEWPVLKLPSKQIAKTGSKTIKGLQLDPLATELKQDKVEPLNWKNSLLFPRPKNSAPLRNINVPNSKINTNNVPVKKSLQKKEKKETKFNDKNYNQKNAEPSISTLIRHTAKSMNRKNVKLVTSGQQYVGSTDSQPINNKKLTIIKNNAPVTSAPSPSATKKPLPKLNEFINQRLNCKSSKQHRNKNDSDFSGTSSTESFAEWLLVCKDSIPKQKIISTLDTIKLDNTKTINRYQILSDFENSKFQELTFIKRCVHEVELKHNNSIFILKSCIENNTDCEGFIW